MYCKYCGKKINNDSQFCKFCGMEIREISPEEDVVKPEEVQTNYFSTNEVTILDEKDEFEKYAENMVKRKIVGTIFRVLFWLCGLYFMFLSCAYSFYMSEYFIMFLKIIFFPFTIVIWPIISLFSYDGLTGSYFWLWLFMMGSYSISTFYGKLRPIG